jgi:hypothetical protein
MIGILKLGEKTGVAAVVQTAVSPNPANAGN